MDDNDKLEVENNIKVLNTILKNLNKAPNRIYRKYTLKCKIDQSRTLYNNTIDCLALNQDKFSTTEFKYFNNCIRNVYGEIHTRILQKIEFARQGLSLFSVAYAFTFCCKLKSKIMAKVDLKLGNSLINTYGGEPENLEAFLESAKLFADLVDAANATPQLKEAANATILRFIKTRLTRTARHILPQANTLDDLCEALKRQHSEKNTPANILARLNVLKQTQTAESFGNEVEKLTEQLKSTYINTGMPANLASKMATDSGLDTLVKGVKNSNTRLILQAGTFATVTEAVQKMLKNDAPTDNNAQMFYNARGNNRGGRGATRGNSRYSHSNHNANYTNNNRRGRGYPNNRYPHQGNNRYQNNRYQNNSRGRGHGRGGYPMYYVQQMGQSQVPLNQNLLPPNFAAMQAPQNPQFISPMTEIPNQQLNNIHPLGQPFGQHHTQ